MALIRTAYLHAYLPLGNYKRWINHGPSGDILYAGQAKSVRGRLIQHFDSSKRSELTTYGRVSIAWWRVESEPLLSRLERGWLESIRLKDGEYPPLNRVGAPL